MKNYLEKSLIKDEIVIKEVKFTNAMYILPVLIFVIGFLSSISLSISSHSVADFFEGILISAVLGLLFAIKGIFYHKFNCLAITNKKIFGKTGIIKTNEMNSPNKQIQNVKVESNFFGKIFKYGTVHITTTSGVYSFGYINKAEEFRNIVMEQIENTEEDKMDLHAQKIADAIKNTK